MSGEIRLKPSDLLLELRMGRFQAESRQEHSADHSGSLKGNLKLLSRLIRDPAGFMLQLPLCQAEGAAFHLEELEEVVFLTQRIC